ncbi:uncharacterized protein KY384_004242 [Bacidia gigantensis]|uniref:uncharacterized protein n=1 Tax=Bacidia gigantensis TaxID=2732470 RepID=UPI001D058736|nr:uncharacterized protein KY384_004242 [Bacidia gigantensis]KAG8530885.1 hypothetical protein KY384_004242 [Bacidia gigantensis]
MVDLNFVLRVDPDVPLRETIITLAELVGEGKIGGVALCEMELSLFNTDPLTNGITDTCFELNIPIYESVVSSMLTGQYKSHDDFLERDIQKAMPRYQPENFAVNMKSVQELEKLAIKKRCTPAQLALGWALTLSKQKHMPVIIPIPGSVRPEMIKENSTPVQLSQEEMNEIDIVLAQFEVAGDRYGARAMRLVNG